MADVIDSSVRMTNTPVKYRDMGDGTFARVIYVVADPGGAAVIAKGRDGQSYPHRFKDMSNGTWARVFAGVNF